MIEASHVAMHLAALVKAEARYQVAQAVHPDDPADGIVPAGEEAVLQARGAVAEALEQWKQGALYGRRERRSPFDRANSDPMFRSLVDHFLVFMRAGEGHFTPTEVREAAMVAQTHHERERGMQFEIAQRDGATRPGARVDLTEPGEIDDGEH